MSILIQINVTNHASFAENIFFFQEPSLHAGGPQVYSNSIQSATVLPHGQRGSAYTLMLTLQYFAGVQQQVLRPVVGQPSGYSSASQPVELTPTSGAPARNGTSMTVVPALALSPGAVVPGVPPGAFRIATPAFNPAVTPYNAGTAVMLSSGQVVLSSFQEAQPSSNLDCKPAMQFYVATGNFAAGTVINFMHAASMAALCDASTGFTTFDVTLNPDHTWTVVPGAGSLSSSEDARGRRSVEMIALPADIGQHSAPAGGAPVQASGIKTPFSFGSLGAPGAASFN